MPKVTHTNKKGLVQSTGTGFTVNDISLTAAAGLVLGIEDVSTATACSTTIPVTFLSHGSDLGVTLADGATVGQVKIFISVTDSTVTNTLNLGGDSATIATTEAGSTYILIWSNAGWQTLSRSSGDNAGATAVAAMPVFAG